MTDSSVEESLAQSEVEVINYLLYEQSPDAHQDEVIEEQWLLELGERPAFYLTHCRLGDSARFIINDLWPYLYRVDLEFHKVVNVDFTKGEIK